MLYWRFRPLSWATENLSFWGEKEYLRKKGGFQYKHRKQSSCTTKNFCTNSMGYKRYILFLVPLRVSLWFQRLGGTHSNSSILQINMTQLKQNQTVITTKIQFLFFMPLKKLILIWESGRERETLIICLLHAPYCGSSPQPWHVPWLAWNLLLLQAMLYQLSHTG